MNAGNWIPITYGIGGAICWRPIFRGLRDDLANTYPLDREDLVACMLFSFFFSLFWPLVAWGWAVKLCFAGREHDPAVIARKIGGESKTQKVQRLEQERTEREEHIRSLERELGIGQ